MIRGDALGDFLNRLLCSRQERGFFQQIRGRIAAHRHLRKYDQIGTLALTGQAYFDDLTDISEEISNGWIDLCQGELHWLSVTSGIVTDKLQPEVVLSVCAKTGVRKKWSKYPCR